MKLKKLLKNLPEVVVKGSKEIEITGVCSSSKLVAPGNLFIARKGRTHDGNRFIHSAIASGAVAILTDIYDPTLRDKVQLIHPDPSSIEGALAASYYQKPSDELFMVAITGTNGKTTTAMYIKHLLDTLGIPTGLIGTIEYIIGSHRYEAQRTTPDVCANHKLLREMVRAGCRAAVMEVTSHALDQGRVDHIIFDVAVFTNLTQDHLDYHLTMENYAKAKNLLFRSLPTTTVKNNELYPTAIINNDSPWAKVISEGCQARILTYSISRPSDFQATNIRFSPEGTHFELAENRELGKFTSPMTGRFNLYNSLATLAVGVARGFSLQELQEPLARFHPVPGRLERVPNALGRCIYVDYAHTEDALRNVLSCLKEVTKGRLLNVFGCGGERDRLKRPHMAAVSEELADLTIVTTDNPRSETAESICAQILAGFSRPDSHRVELDRRSAIETAIKLMNPDDVLLIAGKGHETRQVFAHQTIDFDDRLVAAEVCHQLIAQPRS